MGFIILEANNDELSYIIKKNPSSEPHNKKNRKGICMGFYHDSNTYVVKHTDVEEGVSFPRNKNDTYDYLPYMQYASPMLLVTVVREMFNTILNQTDEKDVSTNCVIEQAIVKLSDQKSI